MFKWDVETFTEFQTATLSIQLILVIFIIIIVFSPQWYCLLSCAVLFLLLKFKGHNYWNFGCFFCNFILRSHVFLLKWWYSLKKTCFIFGLISGWMYFGGTVVGFLSPYISIVVRSMLSKCVTKAELGKIFSLPASIEAGGRSFL